MEELGLLVASNLERSGGASQTVARDFLGQDASEADVTSLRNKIDYQSRKVQAAENQDAVIALLKINEAETINDKTEQNTSSPFASPSSILLKGACRFAYEKVVVDGLSCRKADPGSNDRAIRSKR